MRTMGYWRRFFRVMASPRIVGNALRVSLVVGTVLNLINQGEYLMAGSGLMLGNVALNYLVPFCVSAWSGARALPIHEPGRKQADAREPGR
ncbi:MAG: hypothetical protein OHK0026_02730 [Rhodocyclaceae bacterium]